MILLSLDFETTGLDFEKDRIIEIGAVLFSTGQKKCLDSFGRLVKTDVPITPEITGITSIHPSAVEKFGYDQEESYDILDYMIDSCDAIVGHNVLRFDKRMLYSWANRLEKLPLEKLWIDTMIDIKGHEGKKLTYLAADHGIINHFPHSALADAETVLTIVEKYEINDLVKRANTPTIGVQAHQSRGNNDQAKKLKFRWNPELKIWFKLIKETDLDELVNSVSFKLSVLDKDVFEKINLS